MTLIPKISRPLEIIIAIRASLKNTVRFLITAVLLFVVLFLGSNFSAYSQIASAWLANSLGKPLNPVIITTPEAKNESETDLLPIETVRDPAKLKNDIPALSIEVLPPDNRLIIPRIEKNIPVIRTNTTNYRKQNWDTLDQEILADLKNGVVMYPSSQVPGKGGNTTVTGHSSYYPEPIDNGRYKTVFARLHELILGDRIYFYYDQKKYTYEVSDIQVVKPTDIAVMNPKSTQEQLTLITCTPVGTTLNRLVVEAKRMY